jgi:alcohol dehydrogenase
MPAFVGELTLSRLERVISGPGALSALARELDERGRSRVVVVTGRTLGRSALLGQVRAALGDRCVEVFTGARQHVPSAAVHALTALLRETGADALVSFGGGSPVDAAKAAAHALLTDGGHGGPPALLRASRFGGSAEAGRRREGGPHMDGGTADEPLVHIALPTTLSAGEFTGIAGITDERSRVKDAVSDPRIAPRVVITDPDLTAETPDWLWAATGVRALDHAVESIYSARHHPFSDALASNAIGLLVRHLPGSIRCDDPEKTSHRGYCQMAAWLSVFGIAKTPIGLSHAFGHQIGPRWDVPHGFTSCMMLPHSMRFMAGVAPERFGPIAAGLGVPFDAGDPRSSALACADTVVEFIAQFGVPMRLRDVDVPRHEVGDILEVVHDVMERAQVVGRPLALAELTTLLAAAY